MKRDIDLARSILLQIEQSDSVEGLLSEVSDFRQMERLGYHLHMLQEDGYLEGAIVEYVEIPEKLTRLMKRADVYSRGVPKYRVRGTGSERLTSKGHDLLDLFRDLTIWENIKEKLIGAGKQLETVPFDVVKRVGSKLIADMLC